MCVIDDGVITVMKKIKEVVKRSLSGIVLSFALGFMLCVYAPYELFLTNQGEFWFDAGIMAFPAILFFTGVFFLGCTVYVLLRKWGEKPYRIGLAAGLAVLLFCYVQGNFLVSGLPALDGTNFDWSAPSPERIKSIAAIAVSILLCALLLIKFGKTYFEKITLFASGGLALMLVMTMGTMLLTTPIEDKKSDLNCYTDGQFEYSAEDNFIILLLDALDADEFKAAIDRYPEFADTFDDFTFYSDALAAYPFTLHSVPTILSGEWFEHQEPFMEFANRVIDESVLLNAARDRGYRMGMYGWSGVAWDSNVLGDRFENMHTAEQTYTDPFSFVVMLAKMSALKYAPWDVKAWSYNMQEHSRDVRLVKDLEGHDWYHWTNTALYSQIKDENPIKTVDGKTFRYIHTEGAHVPLQYDKDINLVENGTYQGNVEACVTLCDQYIKRLKESGVYDNSVIVIMSDHGYDPDNGDYRNRMHGTLLIKGKGERADAMRTSDIPVSFIDLADSFVGLLDGKKSDEIFDANAGGERRFIRYAYSKEHFMEEYIAKGKANETELMSPTGVVYEKEK